MCLGDSRVGDTAASGRSAPGTRTSCEAASAASLAAVALAFISATAAAGETSTVAVRETVGTLGSPGLHRNRLSVNSDGTGGNGCIEEGLRLVLGEGTVLSLC